MFNGVRSDAGTRWGRAAAGATETAAGALEATRELEGLADPRPGALADTRGELVASGREPDDPDDPAEPVVSANAIGIAATAEPIPSAIARAPTRPT